MILVSFSLYGDNPKYIIGALKNATDIHALGPEWQSVFYLGSEISLETEADLVDLGALVRRQDVDWHKNGMFWRFMAIHHYEYDFVIFRDVDSRISQRELAALRQWFSSKKILHIMRDHPHHNAIILGGMWGVTSKAKNSNIIWGNSFKYGRNHGQDQVFLEREVYPALRKSVHLNDSFFSVFPSRTKFPAERIGLSYVGESLDQDESYEEDLRLVLEDFLRSPVKRIKILLIFLVHKYF
jgi:hypothetical protein